MAPATAITWKPGMDLPYAVPLGQGRMLAIALRAEWLKADRDGQPLLLPSAVRAIDRLRAVFADQAIPTPGFIIRLREAMGLTQSDFGRKLGVSKMTVSRWECGRMKPGPAATRAILNLRQTAKHDGVMIDGRRDSTRRRAG